MLGEKIPQTRREFSESVTDSAAENLVELRNATFVTLEVLSQVESTIFQLRDIGMHSALYDLVMLCRFPSHRPFVGVAKTLKQAGLISSVGGVYHVEQSVRCIVLAMSYGEGIDMRFRSALHNERQTI